jgi:membrane protease subunit (stomatin/prohibitin family)
MTDFFVGAITPPEDVQRVIDERTGMAAVGDQNSYLRFKAAQAMGDAAKNPSGDGGASSGVGLGVGAGIGMTVAGMMKDAMAPASGARGGDGAVLRELRRKLPDGAKFCPVAGPSAPEPLARFAALLECPGNAEVRCWNSRSPRPDLSTTSCSFPRTRASSRAKSTPKLA